MLNQDEFESGVIPDGVQAARAWQYKASKFESGVIPDGVQARAYDSL